MTLWLARTTTHYCIVEAPDAELARDYAEQALAEAELLAVVLLVEEITLPHLLEQ